MNEALILDLYRNPTHLADTKHWTYKGVAINSHCGDEVTLFLHIHDKMVKKTVFQGTACSLCLAAAELMCRSIQGSSIEKVVQVNVDSALKKFEIESDHKRINCVTLPYQALASITKQLQDEGIVN